MATGGQNEPKTIDLWIIAKSYSPGGHCILGYDEDNKRIRRPIQLSKAGEPQSWSYSEDFKLRKKYRFKLDSSSRQEVLPHAMDDVVVTKASKIKEKELSEHKLYKRLQNCEYPVPSAEEKIADVFPGIKEDINGKRYLLKGSKQHSVGILQTRKNKLHCFKQTKNEKISHMIKLRMENCDCNYTGLDFSNVKEFINNTDEPDQDVLVIFSFGRPLKHVATGEARCYLLAVGLVKGPPDEESD